MHDRAKGKQMAVSTVNLTPTTQQEALRQQCEALAATCAQRALDYDRAGQFPVENFADLRRHGLLGLTIPRELGGLGETYFGFALVVEEIARGCASTGLCFTMHCAGVALVHHNSPAQQQHLARTVVEDGALWTLGFTEPGTGSHFLQPQTTARKVDGGYLLNGIKTFVTSAGAADVVVLNAVVDGAPNNGVTLFLVAPKHNTGASVQQTWDAMGMRANDSRTIQFTDCFVPETDRLGPEGGGTTLLMSRPPYVTLGLAADSVGIAQAALDLATSHAQARTIAGDQKPLSRYQSIRFQVAEMAMAVDAARLMLLRAAWYGDHRPDEASLIMTAAKCFTNDAAFTVANKALQVVGGRGYLKGHAAERLVRDARAGALMAFTAEQSKDLLGKVLLGLDPREVD
jgi:alkylation response protein AidB-like acyl-CoA dehydrogenase